MQLWDITNWSDVAGNTIVGSGIWEIQKWNNSSHKHFRVDARMRVQIISLCLLCALVVLWSQIVIRGFREI